MMNVIFFSHIQVTVAFAIDKDVAQLCLHEPSEIIKCLGWSTNLFQPQSNSAEVCLLFLLSCENSEKH
jgi:hypothetical protein